MAKLRSLLALEDTIRREAIVSLRMMPEDIPIRGNASAIDEKTDDAIARKIESELEQGNDWAWCQVIVTATWKGLRGFDSLGCCSYDSETDFRAKGGYYLDMVEEAIRQIIVQATDIVKEVR